ncbi:type I secretion outer membrane protein, TolC family [Ancylobacter novellus DSM 506]|uniref:Type I secretion outer membrane protein, TolC family n=1 Tax=Ancylobacter novellus (strain ATCC 8093 / DSM 506 / JCM 20403 / CCM 1077 / IAM 12100 / NBRC 12443 / NCIMB 10456) TaxID=639283 RepID=D6ZZ92_ANCN5|nr:TolC family outer membrane protein [Ancylobacter novellus]ADH89228.1 type I secretion outer membrane protein, TolC family [Ancylobacter novellus DSM 506]
MWLSTTGGKVVAFAAVIFGMGFSLPAHAQTLEQALVAAYRNNPTLNSQRAATRATDEYVPIALSGYRPQIFGSAFTGVQWSETRLDRSAAALQGTGALSNMLTFPSGFGITISQTIYDGLKTANSVRSAESQVRGQRELLRNTEQLVLLDAATAYMNVLQNAALLELQKQNLEALREELRAARDRFAVGEITRTDVAQAEASVANAESELALAQSNLNTANAVFYQVIGLRPNKLTPGRPIDRLLPKNLNLAVDLGLSRHPAVKAAEFAVDAGLSNVKVAESALSPTLTLNGSASSDYNSTDNVERQTAAAATLNLTVPIYQGGAEYATIRQTKETLGQLRIEVDVNREQVRANVVQFWGAWEAAKAAIESAQASVAANEIALRGVREEWRVGQRTTLDVLNAQTALFDARASLVIAQRDRVVASYSVLSASGELSATKLSLKVPLYNPQIHYNQVRDAWIGVRTPGGQ